MKGSLYGFSHHIAQRTGMGTPYDIHRTSYRPLLGQRAALGQEVDEATKLYDQAALAIQTLPVTARAEWAELLTECERFLFPANPEDKLATGEAQAKTIACLKALTTALDEEFYLVPGTNRREPRFGEDSRPSDETRENIQDKSPTSGLLLPVAIGAGVLLLVTVL